MSSSNVRVAVRVRPFLPREIARGSKTCFEIDGAATTLIKPEDCEAAGPDRRTFTFDFSYNSFVQPEHPDHASQDTVWNDMGVAVLDSAWEGYNVSLFAYGQTGSGKSYSMMGYGENKGIIPRAVTQIFERIEANEDTDLSYKVECSMLEIYNERIRDLFDAASRVGKTVAQQAADIPLKVRDHPRTGPFVEGLRSFVVDNYEQVNALMERGAEARTIAATNMNASSSRAHTIFTVKLLQRTQQHDEKIKRIAKATEKQSTINLIDLAGSERADSTGATGDRLKEGAAINQSLSALGNVINALAKQAAGIDREKRARKSRKTQALEEVGYGDGVRGSQRKREVVVPYRNSVLTHLLKSALGGNAKTIMIAAISPAGINYAETLSTLRYADRAKQIKNKAVINEDPNARLIRELKDEIARLRASQFADVQSDGATEEEIRKRMEAEKELAIAEMRKQMEAQAAEMEQWKREHINDADGAARSFAAEALASSSDDDKDTPKLVNVNEDPALSGVLKHSLEPGRSMRIGKRLPALQREPPDIILGGPGILAMHAKVTFVPDAGSNGEIKLEVADFKAKIHVNGQPMSMADGTGVRMLRHNDRVLFGNACAFRVDFRRDADAADADFRASEDGLDSMRKPPSEMSVDWELMMNEINRSALDALKGGAGESSVASAAAEKEKAEMAAKLAEMEKRLLEAQSAAQSEMAKQRQAWERENQDKAGDQTARQAQEDAMRRRQDELERKLQNQIEETRRLEEVRDRRRLERSILDDKLLKLLPLVQEANTMAEELGKLLHFGPKLVSRPRKNSASSIGGQNDLVTDVSVLVKFTPPEGSDGADIASEHEAWQDRRVEQAETAEWLWSHVKFMDRLFLMRDMYQQFSEPPVAGDIVALAASVPKENDPFWDPPGDMMLGSARIELEAVSYCMGIGTEGDEDGDSEGGEDAWTPVVDYKGRHVADLHATVAPSLSAPGAAATSADTEDLEEFDELADEALRGRRLWLRVCVAKVRGLDPTFSRFKSTYVSIEPFGGAEQQAERESVAEAGIDSDVPSGSVIGEHRSVNKVLTSVHQQTVGFSSFLPFVISTDLIHRLSSQALVIELWGSFEEPQADDSVVGVTADRQANDAEDNRSRAELLRENRALRAEVQRLREQVAALGGSEQVASSLRNKIEDARRFDNEVNE